MTTDQLQHECERGQAQLMRMEYLLAERTLADAERHAWAARDWDTLARLYMPLQEARRQRRQRCGEGVVCLDLLAESPDDRIDPLHVVKNFSHGQLLVAGWGTIEPAVKVRELAAEQDFYLDTFLAATYPTDAGRAVAIIPLPMSGSVSNPNNLDTRRALRYSEEPAFSPSDPVLRSTSETGVPVLTKGLLPFDELKRLLPANSIVLREDELPRGSRSGTYQTYGEVMAIWERLHTPFLAAADAETDPIQKMEGYRTTIRVDYACELAHQKLSDTARHIR